MQEENIEVACKACTLLQTEGKFTKYDLEDSDWLIDPYDMLCPHVVCMYLISTINENPLLKFVFFNS